MKSLDSITRHDDGKLAWLLFNEDNNVFAVIRCEEKHLDRLSKIIAKEHGVEGCSVGVIPFYEQTEAPPTITRLMKTVL